MVLELASPRMQYTDHPQFPAEMARHRGDGLQGGGALGEEQIVEQLGTRLEREAQFFGHGEGHEKILDRQQPRLLLRRPRRGAVPAAARAGAVVTAYRRFASRGLSSAWLCSEVVTALFGQMSSSCTALQKLLPTAGVALVDVGFVVNQTHGYTRRRRCSQAQ